MIGRHQKLSRADLKAGAKVFIVAVKQPDGCSRVVRGASAAMAQHRPSDRVGFLPRMGLHPAFPGRNHRVSPVGPSMGFAALSAHPLFESRTDVWRAT